MGLLPPSLYRRVKPLRIGPADMTDLSAFPLRWRWTPERSAGFTEDLLARIQPLQPEKARELCQLALTSLSAEPGDFDIITRLFEHPVRIDTRSADVVAWLTERIPAGVPIVVSWNCDVAVLTDSDLFIAHWDDFCYPSSDDVSVFPLDAGWVLHFWHEEQFLYATPRTT